MSGWMRAMSWRDPEEQHRAATPLELFFDLVFVVAIAQAATSLHHALIEGHPREGAIGFAIAFFAIWWAWMNWTWFASAFDCDDALYRVTTFVQMFGALVLAAGVQDAFEGHFELGVAGYVIMRLAQVCQWLRAAISNPRHRRTALRYVFGITLVQVLWTLRLWVPGTWGWAAFAVLIVADLAVPWFAERAGSTPWHPHHVAERFLLMTIIVLGEVVLASVLAIREAVVGGAGLASLAWVAVSAFVSVCSMWWLYTSRSAHGFLARGNREAFPWGYGHYFLFASIAAYGAAVAAVVDAEAESHGHADPRVLAGALAIPVALFLVTLWTVHFRPHRLGAGPAVCLGAAAALVLLTTLTAAPLELIAVLLVTTVFVSGRLARSPH